MGKIDKEKLLSYLEGKSTLNIGEVIKHFPEEPQIDMDQLRNEVYSEIVKNRTDEKTVCKWCNESVNKCDGCKDYSNFYAKSKQKPFEIPVKKTWTLKKEYVEFSNDFKAVTDKSFELSCDPVEKLKKYYDMHEEPDYSKIPKGSIVELKNSLRRLVIVFNGVLGDKVCGTQNDHYTISNYEIRIVELAKE